MLPKINRLKNTKDIEMVFKGGQGSKTGFLFVKASKNSLATSRFAFIISKKVVAKAVKRNQIKRKLRSIIKELMPQIKPGFDIIMVAQKGMGKQDFSNTKEDIITTLRKIKLLN